jgi:TPR repeat protein
MVMGIVFMCSHSAQAVTLPGSKVGSLIRKLRMTTPEIDYKALEFTCSREIDHVPTPTPEAEAIYEAARLQYRQAVDGPVADTALLQKAVNGYDQAARAGHWKAVRNLALMAASGVNHGQQVLIKPDSSLAFNHASRLLDMNVATGYNLMASFAYSGWGVKQNEEVALKYMRHAADLGSVDAMRQLGMKFIYGFKDLTREQKKPLWEIGKNMLACATRQGDREAASTLASVYEYILNNYPYALFYLQQAGKMGDGTNLSILADWFRDGSHGYAVDEHRAKRYKFYSDKTNYVGGDVPLPNLDQELSLPPPPNGGSYPSAEMGWPNAWTPAPHKPDAPQ